MAVVMIQGELYMMSLHCSNEREFSVQGYSSKTEDRAKDKKH